MEFCGPKPLRVADDVKDGSHCLITLSVLHLAMLGVGFAHRQ